MKKLLTLLSAATVAIGLYADVYDYSGVDAATGTSFEGLTVDETDVATIIGAPDDLNGGSGYWETTNDASLVKLRVEGGTSVRHMSGYKYPEQFAGTDQEKFLHVESTFGNPLKRYVQAEKTSESFSDSSFYFDSLVKFTAFDEGLPEVVTNELAGAKIAVWLQDDGTATNLYIRAGKLGNDDVTAESYNCGSAFGSAEDWHRLTIKAIGNIYEDDYAVVPGFVVFVDNVIQGSSDDKGIVASKLRSSCDGYNTNTGLFPSMDLQSSQMTKITSVEFDGQGDIDDVVFTANAPEFAKDPALVKITWAASDIESVVINDRPYTASPVWVNYVEDTPITVSNIVYTANKTGDETQTHTFAEAGQEWSLTASDVVATFGGAKFATLGAAITAANEATADGVLKLFGTTGNEEITINNANARITIDLNGLTITSITAQTPVTIIDSGILGTVNGAVSLADNSLISAGRFDATNNSDEDKKLPNGVIIKKGLNNYAADGYKFVKGGSYFVLHEAAEVAENAWWTNPAAVVLAENLPKETGKYVSAFHGQGEGEYLGLTFGTNPLQFNLYSVDGTNTPTTVTSVAAEAVTTPGFRGVAISKTLGIAMTLAYATTTTMYAFPLAGGAPVAVSKPSTHAFDSAAFSVDGKYLFSNAIEGEGSKSPACVKWSVAINNGAIVLTKIGAINASGRNRNIAYANINGRDLVFAMADTGKIDVVDMTGDDTSAWSSATLISGLPAHSYGSLCLSGIYADDATPHLTVATSVNNGATKVDVLNVYELTVPASGAVTATLAKSFDEDAMTAAGFGDISDADRYGNTVYVTDDEATIYFARPDNKLYAAQYVAPAPSGEEIVPGGQSSTTYDTQAAAEAALANVTITVPAAVEAALDDPAAQADYLAKFEKKVVSVGENQYKVEIALTAVAKEALQTEVDGEVGEIVDAIDEGSVEITTTPGFFYSIKYGESLDAMNYNTASELATGTSTTLTMPAKAGTAGFYSVVVDAIPSAAVAPAQD